MLGAPLIGHDATVAVHARGAGVGEQLDGRFIPQAPVPEGQVLVRLGEQLRP